MNLSFFIFSYFPYGGLERNFLRITEACLAKGHQVDIYTMSWQGEKPQGAQVITVPASGLTNHGRCASYVEALEKMIEPGTYDLRVGFNRMPGLDLYYTADVCYILDIKKRRGLLARLTPRYRVFSSFERAVFGPESHTHIMILAEAEKANYVRAYGTPEKRFHDLPPGIDRQRIKAALKPDVAEELRQQLGLPQESLILLAIGSDFVRKGVERSVRAMASLPEKIRQQTHLLVVGKGKAKPLLKLASRLQVKDNLRVIGTSDQVPGFLAGADLLLHPAISENTGNVIAEALVAGLPVLATDTCGYGFHVRNSGAGSLIKGLPFNQQEMNQTLAKMLESNDRHEWGQQALEYADRTDLYSRPQKALEIIESLLEQRR